MATVKPRINMVLDPEDYSELKALAKHEGRSLSDLARSLVMEMMEITEDRGLAALASERRKTFSAQAALTHKQVWGNKADPSLTKRGVHGLRRHVSLRRRKARPT